jgi:hypothetical protein
MLSIESRKQFDSNSSAVFSRNCSRDFPKAQRFVEGLHRRWTSSKLRICVRRPLSVDFMMKKICGWTAVLVGQHRC